MAERAAPRIAANIGLLFGHLPPLDRPAAARDAGFDGVELLFPYDNPPAAWAAALAGLPVVQVNTPPGDWAAGERGFAAVPGAEGRFRADFGRALDWAAATGAGRIHVMAGVAAGPAARATFLRNLDWAAGRGLPLCIEPLNPIDMPGYFLADFAQAAAILHDLGAPHVGLQFDIWHAERLGGAAAQWAAHGAQAVHLQIAGLTARAEPCEAALAFAAAGVAGGYGGWI
ncbi:MAG TPA: TIM barrel protein, partial [Paracoccaceae bacterium]|nr:TIM barrel protein [Paracoccaceae bacterium]